ncbi:DsbA family protein [Chryseobacterium sp. RR2-3-20]|uniref:DsbA family oxidoreductase n=1 Tax=Chryseobacterium sp. RR2-3-20 TaxID=2787626 RepID=UPI001ADFE20D|nr:DsbA family oxidoreductase [Chryseobacterium sp. RR2-3-20]
MKVEIWSDIMYPFCYIGKKNFEKVLDKLPFKDEIEVEWKSFQLDPSLNPSETMTTQEYFTAKKRISPEQGQQLSAQVIDMGKRAGIDFNFKDAIITNTYNAHKLLHLAKKYNKAIEMEEELFKAHFLDGKNIGSDSDLVEIGGNIGIPDEEIEKCLESNDFDAEIQFDFDKAKAYGVSGVPFFVFDSKYGVSGAQPSEVFEDTLRQTYAETEKLIKKDSVNDLSCGPDGCII